MSWEKDGLCGQTDPELFHPDRGGRKDAAKAKSVCAKCGVRLKCLDHALKNPSLSGIWGGTSEGDRKKMRRKK